MKTCLTLALFFVSMTAHLLCAEDRGAQFIGGYVKGKPVGQQLGILLRFDPRRSRTGDSVFTGVAIPGGNIVTIDHHVSDSTGNKMLYFRRARPGENASAFFNLTVSGGNGRPAMVRVDPASGKPIIYIEPLP